MPASDIAGEIKQELEALTPDEFASQRILEPVPHAFKGDLQALTRWKTELGEGLEVDPRAIAVVGSAAIGVSLSPGKLLSPFGDDSDVDVAVISAFHFEQAWRELRSLPARMLASLTEAQLRSVTEFLPKDIFWGTVATDKILELLTFGRTWIRALNRMEGRDPTAGRTVNARIYRDFESLRAYQLRGVTRAQAELSNQ